MAIEPGDIRFYQSATVGGGARSAVEVTRTNLWPVVSTTELQTGSTRYRKLFIQVDDQATLQDPLIFVAAQVSGQDRVVIFPGTPTDTLDDLTGGERLYGAGYLVRDSSPGARSLLVRVGSGYDRIFREGDLIRISDKTSVDDPHGDVEYLRLAANDAVWWDGDFATLTFASGATPAAFYQAHSTRVASSSNLATSKPPLTPGASPPSPAPTTRPPTPPSWTTSAASKRPGPSPSPAPRPSPVPAIGSERSGAAPSVPALLRATALTENPTSPWQPPAGAGVGPPAKPLFLKPTRLPWRSGKNGSSPPERRAMPIIR